MRILNSPKATSRFPHNLKYIDKVYKDYTNMKETHNYIHYIQSGVNLKSDNDAVGRTQHKQMLGRRRNKRVSGERKGKK